MRRALSWPLQPRMVLAGLVIMLCVANLVITLRRSLISVGLDGVVTDMEVRFEKHPGKDDVHLVVIDGQRVHVTSAVGSELRLGDHVRKRPFSMALETPRGPVALRPPVDFTRMLIVMPLAAVVVIAQVLSTPKGSGRTMQ